MAKCDITGKRGLVGNKVSHANNKTKTIQKPNVQKKKFYLAEQDRWVTLKVSTRALRSITRVGLEAYAKKYGVDLKTFIH